VTFDSFACHLDVSFGADDVLRRGHAVLSKVLNAGEKLAQEGQIELGDRELLSDAVAVRLQIPAMD
jgi:hypothetical protein